MPVRIEIEFAVPRLQRESYSPQDFPTEPRSQSAQCRALGQHQTAIVTPFWVRGSARFAKRTAPSSGMREMCINNIIHHGPTEFCRCLQPDKCLYHLNLAVDQDFLQYVDKATAALDVDFHQYDQEQRAMCRVATASSESEVRQFLPLPHTGTLAFTLPDIQKDPPSIHNMGRTLDDHFAREHVFLVDFYVGAVNSFWDDYQNDILQEWQIFDAPSVDICRIGLIPLDHYVSASAD